MIVILFDAGYVFEMYARKMRVTISLPSARSLHNTDVRDSFLTVQAARSKEKMCVIASLPLRLSARSLRRKDVRDSFLTVQVVRSKFTYDRS